MTPGWSPRPLPSQNGKSLRISQIATLQEAGGGGGGGEGCKPKELEVSQVFLIGVVVYSIHIYGD